MGLRLIHISPELPPAVGGVADYTAILSRRLVELGEIEPVLLHAGWQEASTIEVDFPVVDLSGQCSAEVLANAVDQLTHTTDQQAVILLEYSGYGYAKRGAPLWLERGLRMICGEESPPLLTMFHELYATGPLWSSSFWMSPFQRYVAAHLATLSRALFTNRETSVSWLRPYRRSDQVPIRVQPVFSNVGEPEHLPNFAQRAPHAVVFGGGSRKSKIYDTRAPIQSLLDCGIHQILDIGPSKNLSSSDEKEVNFRGVLPASEISKCLSSSLLGLLSYPGSRLGKSGVAAAFASHGLPFILFDAEECPGNTSPYVEGKHFWRWSTIDTLEEKLSSAILEERSRAIRTLYETRIHSVHSARGVYETLADVVTPPPEQSANLE